MGAKILVKTRRQPAIQSPLPLLERNTYTLHIFANRRDRNELRNHRRNFEGIRQYKEVITGDPGVHVIHSTT